MIAIGNRQTHACTLFVDQHDIHTPGVDTNTVNSDALRAGFFQPETNFIFQCINVPTVKTVVFFQLVGEAMNFTQREGPLFRRVAGQHYTPAGGA